MRPSHKPLRNLAHQLVGGITCIRAAVITDVHLGQRPQIRRSEGNFSHRPWSSEYLDCLRDGLRSLRKRGYSDRTVGLAVELHWQWSSCGTQRLHQFGSRLRHAELGH